MEENIKYKIKIGKCVASSGPPQWGEGQSPEDAKFA